MAARAKKNFCQSDLLTPCSRHSSPSACTVEIWSTLTYTEFDCVALLAMLYKKKKLVQLCDYMTREFSSTFSRNNRQRSEMSIPAEKCFKVVQKPCGRVGKRKYNLNGISTALRRHF